MDRSSRRRIWKVEKLLSKTEELVSIARQKCEKSQEERLACLMPLMRRDARLHATAVAAIVMSGEPKIDEPLVRAWERALAHHRINVQDSTLDKEALKAAEKMYPAIVEDPDYGRPHHWWDPNIVHAPEAARFTEIFRTAPVWLLQFTRMRWDASLLEFDLPDYSDEPIMGMEGVNDMKRWPRLPLGMMLAGDPVRIRVPREEFESDSLSEIRRFFQEMRERPEEERSRLELRRWRELDELSHKNS